MCIPNKIKSQKPQHKLYRNAKSISVLLDEYSVCN